MPSEQDFIRIEALAARLSREAPDHPYRPWLAARGAGLKQRAAEALAVFLRAAAGWSQTRRREFVVWLEAERRTLDDAGAIVPFPLLAELVLPTLHAWTEREPDQAMPHLLLARFHHWKLAREAPLAYFRRALARDRDLEPARRGVIDALIDHVERSQHHLPHGYLGDRQADAADMDEAWALAQALPDADDLVAYIAVLRERALGRRDDGGLVTYAFER